MTNWSDPVDPADAPTARRLVLAILLAGVALWGVALHRRALLDPDEGRYAEIPREMLESGDWITPRLNGFLYFEKPPLQYWATAIAYRVFGVSDWASRLFTVLCAALTVLVVARTGRRLFGPEAGRAAAWVLAGNGLFLGLAGFNTLDMGTTFLLTATVAAFLLAQARRDEPAAVRRHMLLCYAFMALGVLQKGLIGLVLPGGVLVTYVLVQGDRAVLRHLHAGKGLLLLLALAAPWFVAVSLRNPGFAEFFFVHEHLGRFLESGHHRGQPAYFFLLVLVAGLLPFTIVAGRGLVRAGWGDERRGGFSPTRLLLVWVVFVFLFFSASRSKLVGYIGPVVPAIALLAGVDLARTGHRGLRATAWISLTASGLLLLAAPFLTLIPIRYFTPGTLSEPRNWLVAGAAVLVAGSVWVLRAVSKGARPWAVPALAATWLAGVGILMNGLAATGPVLSRRDDAAAMRAVLGLDTPVFDVDRFDQSLCFYLGRPVTVVLYRGELDFGIGHDPGRFVPDFAEFMRIWAGAEQATALMDRDTYDDWFRGKGLPHRLLAEGPVRVILARR